MFKYIYLFVGIMTAVTGVALVFYGIYTERLYLCGEAVIYAVITLCLFNNYNEEKRKENDGI